MDKELEAALRARIDHLEEALYEIAIQESHEEARDLSGKVNGPSEEWLRKAWDAVINGARAAINKMTVGTVECDWCSAPVVSINEAVPRRCASCIKRLAEEAKRNKDRGL